MKDEIGWVIECYATGRIAYWAGPQLWSWEHLEAVRFARKEDAERVARHPSCQGIPTLRVTEHMWCPVGTPEPAADHVTNPERYADSCCEDIDDEYACTRVAGHEGRCEYLGPHGFHFSPTDQV
jgi:hypothetical protein